MNARITLTYAAAAFVALAAGSAAGAQDMETRSVAVSYKDLDLSSAAGRATINRRLLSAARSVCQVEGFQPDLTLYRQQAKCLKDALGGGLSALEIRLRPTMAAR